MPAKKPAAATAASQDADTEAIGAGEASVAESLPADGDNGADGQGALDLGGMQGAENAAEAVDSPAVADSSDAADGSGEDALMPVPGAVLRRTAHGLIHPNRKQPRSVFDEEDMAELVHSVREIGILQPVVVRPSSESGDHLRTRHG